MNPLPVQQDELTRMESLFAAGSDPFSVALEFNISESGLRQRLRRWGYATQPYWVLLKVPGTEAPPGTPRHLTESGIHQLGVYLADGYSPSAAARLLGEGVQPMTLKAWLREWGYEVEKRYRIKKMT
jgi:hypothetical protein